MLILLLCLTMINCVSILNYHDDVQFRDKNDEVDIIKDTTHFFDRNEYEK